MTEKQNNNDEHSNVVYRNFYYFYSNNLPVHFKNINNVTWYNGSIESLDLATETLILKERVRGTIPIPFKQIKSDSIILFMEKKK